MWHFIDDCKSFDFAHTMGRDGKLLEGLNIGMKSSVLYFKSIFLAAFEKRPKRGKLGSRVTVGQL